MKVNDKTYSTFEGANKSKILERYLYGQNEQGEVSMMDFVAKIEDSSKASRKFESIDLVLENQYSMDQMLKSQRDLSKIISKNF